jgi:nicotinate-nucleotide--dimethylbenzimidazole phosphoribosyltransferase
MKVQEIISRITPIDRTIEEQAWQKMNNKTKPLGALGELERIAVQMSLVQNNLNPIIEKKLLFIFAADHGLTEQKLSAYPTEVTAQMVLNFLQGGAAINVMCRDQGIGLKIIDMGTKYDFRGTAGVIDKKVRLGTSNFLKEPAMSREEAAAALQNGADVFNEAADRERIDIIGVGDMGIGNTTCAAAIVSAITGVSPAKNTGRGTGINNQTLKRKIQAIRKALDLHKINSQDPLDVLAKVGGLEIGGIAGTILAAARRKVPVVLDGLISTAGGLLAWLFNPLVRDYLFAGHKSVERGHGIALRFLDLSPILDLALRLGEGTGAALAMYIIDVSCRLMREMASFAEAKVHTSL